MEADKQIQKMADRHGVPLRSGSAVRVRHEGAELLGHVMGHDSTESGRVGQTRIVPEKDTILVAVGEGASGTYVTLHPAQVQYLEDGRVVWTPDDW